MAPEQAEGHSALADERTDVYGLGAILYNILTLSPPIQGGDRATLLARIKAGEICPPTKFHLHGTQRISLPHLARGKIPISLSAVAAKALATRPEDRYQTVQELQKEVGDFQSGFAPAAEGANLLTQLKLLIIRHKTEFLLSGAALLVIIAIITASFVKVTNTLAELKKTAPTFHAEAEGLLDTGRFGDALEKIKYALKLDANNSAYLALKGDLLQTSVRLQEARDAYAAALKSAPNHSAARANLALCDTLLVMSRGQPIGS